MASQALQTWSYQQQVLYNQRQILNRPVATTCTYIGNVVQCF
jgi:hypothetical protein